MKTLFYFRLDPKNSFSRKKDIEKDIESDVVHWFLNCDVLMPEVSSSLVCFDDSSAIASWFSVISHVFQEDFKISKQ